VPILSTLLCFFCLWWPISVSADEFGVVVKSAEMKLQGDNYVLAAEVDYQLSMRAKEALENGIPLYWIVQVKVLQHRDMLWNKTLVEGSIRYKIQYHALLNMYRIKNEYTSEVTNFSTLAAALDSMSKVRNFSVIDKAALAPDQHYFAAVQVKLDRDSLPLPLRPTAYVSPQWFLSSAWYVWSLTN